jgi:hypothetical protein
LQAFAETLAPALLRFDDRFRDVVVVRRGVHACSLAGADRDAQRRCGTIGMIALGSEDPEALLRRHGNDLPRASRRNGFGRAGACPAPEPVAMTASTRADRHQYTLTNSRSNAGSRRTRSATIGTICELLCALIGELPGDCGFAQWFARITFGASSPNCTRAGLGGRSLGTHPVSLAGLSIAGSACAARSPTTRSTACGRRKAPKRCPKRSVAR